MKYEIEIRGPLEGNKLVELLKQGYVLSIIYTDADDVKKDIEKGNIDDLLKDPMLKTLKLVIKNENFVNPYDPRNFFRNESALKIIKEEKNDNPNKNK